MGPDGPSLDEGGLSSPRQQYHGDHGSKSQSHGHGHRSSASSVSSHYRQRDSGGGSRGSSRPESPSESDPHLKNRRDKRVAAGAKYTAQQRRTQSSPSPRNGEDMSASRRGGDENMDSNRRDQNRESPEDTGKHRDRRSPTPNDQDPGANPPAKEPGGAAVTPDLLVEALSGHEDGLLAIAERLMEHYDGGYDVMGEAIIDAFADVQKLFQHAVEAAHMEGAAFEANRAREERAAKAAANGGPDDTLDGGADINHSDPQQGGPVGGMPPRVEEFVDQDVKDVLREAIQKGNSIMAGRGKSSGNKNKHMDCYELYERACHGASALLPVDSDHRGRLQLAVARAENLSPERACAILRYAMDDVIRAGSGPIAPPPDADEDRRSGGGPDGMGGSSPAPGGVGSGGASGSAGPGGLGLPSQSSEEALDSLVEEMKEVLSAPVYERSPIQPVARRFWNALSDARRNMSKNEEALEHRLGKLKGDYLLAKAEWEEKLSVAEADADTIRKECEKLREHASRSRPSGVGSPTYGHPPRNPSSAGSVSGADPQFHGGGIGTGGSFGGHSNTGSGAESGTPQRLMNMARDNFSSIRGFSSSSDAGGGTPNRYSVGMQNVPVPPKSPGDRSRAPSVVSSASSFARRAGSMVGSFTQCAKGGQIPGANMGTGMGSGGSVTGRGRQRKAFSTPTSTASVQ